MQGEGQQCRRGAGIAATLLLAGMACACTAELGAKAGQDGNDPAAETATASSRDIPNENPTSFTCDESLAPATPGMRRLTKRQYENTLSDLLEAIMGDRAAARSALDAVSDALALVPEDRPVEIEVDSHGSYSRIDQTVQQSHVDAWYDLAVELGAELTREEHIDSVVGDCGEGEVTGSGGCVEAFVQRFGAQALRRPLSADEVDFYSAFYEPSTSYDPEAFADVIAGLLNAPQFLYQVEHGEAAVEAREQTRRLSGYELASRLSYHFWNTMPDERLFAAAEDGSLLTEAGYLAEVDRMWADPRTKRTLHEFFSEWMKLEKLADLTQNQQAALYQNFAGDALPSDDLRAAMIDEVVALLDYFTWEQPGGIEQIFMTNAAFAKSEELAELYGIAPWDGESEPPTFAEPRPGVLTRAALLATGTANTRPIMKGVFIRTNILCDKIPPPPENAMALPPALDPKLSTRQVVEVLTEQPDEGCRGCHSSLINPLGFATENFDALGRFRSEQRLFGDEGEELGTVPIDTTSIPQVLSQDETFSEGPQDLMGLIVDSGKATSCAVRHYFRFSFGRGEGVVSDGCALETMRVALEETGSLAGMLREVALTDAFREKTFRLNDATGGVQ